MCDPAAGGNAQLEQLLERNWRRVASTHTLQDLLRADLPPPGDGRGPDWKIVALGSLLVAVGGVTFALATYAMLMAPWMPPAQHAWLRAIQLDHYYHLLVPLTVPVTIVAIFVNWFSMKLFKHNS